MRKELMTVCRDYEQSAERLWAVVSDIDRYADHVTGLKASPVLSGDGEGAVRQCRTIKDETWSETVSRWVDGELYEIEVDASTYPFPLRQVFRRFTGTWRVEPRGEGSKVCMTFTPDVRGGYAVWPLVVLGARQTRRDLEYTLESYGRAAASED